MAARYARFILRHGWTTIALVLLCITAMGSGVQFLTLTNDYHVFFGDDNPQLQAFAKLQDTYARNDNAMFVLAPRDGKVFTRKTLGAIAWLTERAWQTPYSTRVESITNYQHTSAAGDDLIVMDLADLADGEDDAMLEQIRAIALNEPVLINRLVSPRAHVAGVNVTIQLPGIDPLAENPEVVEFVRALRTEFRARYPDIDVKLTGIIIMNQAYPEASLYDMSTLFPLMLLLFMGVLLFWVKEWSGALATFAIIVFSIVGAMGLAGWLGIALTPPALAAIMIIPTVAIADSVHLLMSYLQARRTGLGREAAMVDSMRINLQPVFLTSLTTTIGFLSMNFSDAPPFHDLGNIVAIGVTIAFVLSISFLPALMLLLPGREQLGETAANRVMKSLAEFVIARRRLLLLAFVPGSLLIIAAVPLNELNDDFVKFFSERIEFRRDTDFALQNLGGLHLLDYSLESGQEGGISEPEFQHNIDQFANWYRQQPEVIHVNVIADTFRRLNRSMHGDDPDWYRLPAERELAAQYLLLYEMSLPYGLDLNNQINIDKSATRMTVMLSHMTTRGVLELEQRAQQWMHANLPPVMHNEAASPTIMFSHIGERNVKSMLLGTTIALVLISVILVFALRSLKIGLLSLVPNLIPAALAFGVWGLLDGQVGLALSIVTGMTLGIVVDDTVHFLSKYLRARREKGLGCEDAVRYAFSTVGLALVVTSLVLVAGFMVLTFSAFTLNSSMALMTAVTIVFALIADFLLLPPLLMAFDSKEKINAPI